MKKHSKQKCNTEQSSETRIAIINKERCKPNKCSFECGLTCPINRQRKECITLVDIEDISGNKKIAKINEDFCIGCGLCAKEPENRGCPFGAVQIVKIPTELQQHIIHRYGPNGFKLYKMPNMKKGIVTGLIGQNGIGKSTIIGILSGNIIPNFEDYDNYGQPLNNRQDVQKIISKFKGNELHKYMEKLYGNELSISIKPQNVCLLINTLKTKKINPMVLDYINKRSKYDPTDDFYNKVLTDLELYHLLRSNVICLSGGELQRLICATVILSKSDVYIFDEPSNFLDVHQRLKMSELIRSISNENTYVLVIEHDMSILDYISDSVCIMYGHPNAYGVVSKPSGTATAINSYFDGYIKAENIRIRTSGYNINLMNIPTETTNVISNINDSYNASVIGYDNFELQIEEGTFPMEGSITVVMGKNGTGKTTFINYIASQLCERAVVSHKKQYLSVDEFEFTNGEYPTVNEFLMNEIRDNFVNNLFISDVVNPMGIESIKNIKLNELSGGNLQKVFIVHCLGKDAQIYLIDEPSANLDIENRVTISKMLKKFTAHNKKVLFVVEHDMMINISLGSEPTTQSIIVNKIDQIDNIRKCVAYAPTTFSNGVNNFLKILNVTFHTQQVTGTGRPRINKYGSVKDREQKYDGNYYL